MFNMYVLHHCNGDTVHKSIIDGVKTMPFNEAVPCISVPVKDQLMFTLSAICFEHKRLTESLNEPMSVRKQSSEIGC